jgi:hypothetical protein
MSSLISACLGGRHTLISVMGPHAGEESLPIFQRKIIDISRVGWTLWLIRSYKAKPDRVQAMCQYTSPIYVAFVEPPSPGGAQPTMTSAAATEYSSDQHDWVPLPPELGPVTGHLGRGAYALLLDRMEFCSRTDQIDLWDYCEFDTTGARSKPSVAIKQGCSTICAERLTSKSGQSGMKSRYRRVIACGRLRTPSAVWVR